MQTPGSCSNKRPYGWWDPTIWYRMYDSNTCYQCLGHRLLHGIFSIYVTFPSLLFLSSASFYSFPFSFPFPLLWVQVRKFVIDKPLTGGHGGRTLVGEPVLYSMCGVSTLTCSYEWIYSNVTARTRVSNPEKKWKLSLVEFGAGLLQVIYGLWACPPQTAGRYADSMGW